MKPWIAGVLGLVAGILIVTGNGVFHSQTSPNPQSYEAPKLAAARTSGGTLSASLAQLTRSTGAATGSPTPAEASAPEAKLAAAAVPTRIDEEGKRALPDFLRKRLEPDSGPSGIREFHALISREARDPDWAPATEYGVQDTLQELAPDLFARMQFFQAAAVHRSQRASGVCRAIREGSARRQQAREPRAAHSRLRLRISMVHSMSSPRFCSTRIGT
jgi:hypothetical protein